MSPALDNVHSLNHFLLPRFAQVRRQLISLHHGLHKSPHFVSLQFQVRVARRISLHRETMDTGSLFV